MTTIACWFGADTHGPASLYIASDSRISWSAPGAVDDPARPRLMWDQGRKVFACHEQPHIFGYYGNVVFPALAIPSVCELIDRRLLPSTTNPTRWHLQVKKTFDGLFSDYPRDAMTTCGIIHGLRIGAGTSCTFSLAVLTWKPGQERFEIKRVSISGTKSGILVLEGTGSRAVQDMRVEWSKSAHRDTSRAEFSAFCDGLRSARDPNTGGAPQLAGLYRIGPGRPFGVVWRGQATVAGRRRISLEDRAAGRQVIGWHNELFEIADRDTRRRRPGAQRHGRPALEPSGPAGDDGPA